MGEYAGKGVAGSALGIAIGGLTAALLNNDGDGIGGLIGNGGSKKNEKILELTSENSLLKANFYTEQQLTGIRAEMAKQSEQIACINTQMALRDQIVDGKIAQTALVAKNGIDQLQCALACLQKSVDGITATYVPAQQVTPLPMPSPWPGFPYPPMPPFVPPQQTTQSGTTQTQTGGQ